MGRLERKIERAIIRGLFNLLVWILLAPFKILKWIFSGSKPKKHISSQGYIVLADINELEHRYIAKQLLGRELYSNEVVHHINGGKTDNAVNNLCLMDGEKHEHFHAWLRWKKEKNGKYPTISKQKRVLESEYGGALLENVTPPKKEAPEPEPTAIEEPIENETFLARRNKASQKFFLDFEEEVLISPEGRVIEIDDERFEELEEVTQSGLTEKQLEVYNNKLDNYQAEVSSRGNGADIHKQLFKKLKKERLKLARENKVPAYLIFHDKTLIEMAQVMPVSEALMLQIRGVGPEKMEKYGNRFISVIRTFKSNNEESA